MVVELIDATFHFTFNYALIFLVLFQSIILWIIEKKMETYHCPLPSQSWSNLTKFRLGDQYCPISMDYHYIQKKFRNKNKKKIK